MMRWFIDEETRNRIGKQARKEGRKEEEEDNYF